MDPNGAPAPRATALRVPNSKEFLFSLSPLGPRLPLGSYRPLVRAFSALTNIAGPARGMGQGAGGLVRTEYDPPADEVDQERSSFIAWC